MNLPHIGQRLSENLGIFSPYPGGAVWIIHITRNVAILNNDKTVWILPDGRLTRQKLDPFPRYRPVLDYFEPNNKGRVVITGRYPNFETNFGQQVWLDGDGRMKPFDPGPIAERFQMVVRQRRGSGKERRFIQEQRRCLQCDNKYLSVRREQRFCSDICRSRFSYLSSREHLASLVHRD